MPNEPIRNVVDGSAAWATSKDEAQAVFFDNLFGAGHRYPEAARRCVKLRAPLTPTDAGVPFAAYIEPSNPDVGAYSGMSLAIFPIPGKPSLVTFVVGTAGFQPDDEILGRPGHARKIQALCAWINETYGQGQLIAWAKQDPIRTDIAVPETVTREMPDYDAVFKKYGSVIYALFRPTNDAAGTEDALAALLDLMFEERGYRTMAGFAESARSLRSAWFAHLMPSVSIDEVQDLLRTRRFVVIQGPPGTGKTRMARQLVQSAYAGNGTSVQFHPNTTYENFIGGLAPVTSTSSLGLAFAPQCGFLMNAAAAALATPDRDYLLHIDEINRADLSKILGEAIYLLEPYDERSIHLPYDFGDPFGHTLTLPSNLHIVGTMNSADRSLAIVDVAVRRRFAFTKLWPQTSVVAEHGNKLMQDAFERLLTIFVEHASGDAFDLVPGHSYFLENNSEDESVAIRQLRTTLVPLLEEYIAQGYVASFSEAIRSYLQWIDSL